MNASPHDHLGEMMDQRAQELGATDRFERKMLIKEALREGIKEWLDDRYREVGKWSVRGIAAAAFAALVYFILAHGAVMKP